MIAEVVAVSYEVKAPEVKVSAEKFAFVSTATGAAVSALLLTFLGV